MYSLVKFKKEGHEGIGVIIKNSLKTILSNSIKNYRYNQNLKPLNKLEFSNLSPYYKIKENLIDYNSYILSTDKKIKNKVFNICNEYNKKISEFNSKKERNYGYIDENGLIVENRNPYIITNPIIKNNIITKNDIKNYNTISNSKKRIIDQTLINLKCKIPDRLKSLTYNEYLSYFPHILRDNSITINVGNGSIHFENEIEFKQSFSIIRTIGYTLYSGLISTMYSTKIGTFPLLITKNNIDENVMLKPFKRIPAL